MRGLAEMKAFYLETALHLCPHEEKDVLFCFDKKCSEDSMVSRHPFFTAPEVKVVGEVGTEATTCTSASKIFVKVLGPIAPSG